MYHLLVIKKEGDKLVIEALNASLTEVTALVHIHIKEVKKAVSYSLCLNKEQQ